MTEETEEWRDVIGYEGKYKVSNLGRIKMLWRGTYLRPHIINIKHKNGYCYVNLSYLGTVSTRLLSRIVAQAFIPNPNCYKWVLHKDGDLDNNRADNLYWSKNHDNFLPETKFKKRQNNTCNSD